MRDSLENEAAQVLLEIERVTGNQAPIPRRDPATAANPRQYSRHRLQPVGLYTLQGLKSNRLKPVPLKAAARFRFTRNYFAHEEMEQSAFAGSF